MPIKLKRSEGEEVQFIKKRKYCDINTVSRVTIDTEA